MHWNMLHAAINHGCGTKSQLLLTKIYEAFPVHYLYYLSADYKLSKPNSVIGLTDITVHTNMSGHPT